MDTEQIYENLKSIFYIFKNSCWKGRRRRGGGEEKDKEEEEEEEEEGTYGIRGKGSRKMRSSVGVEEGGGVGGVL